MTKRNEVSGAKPKVEPLRVSDEHTPTPEVRHFIDGSYMIEGKSYSQNEIVRAVNSLEQLEAENARLKYAHEGNIEAMENAIDDLNFDGTYTNEEILKTVEQVREELRQAITRASEVK